MLRKHYPTLQKEFVNPFGTRGAYVGAFIFSLCLVGSLVFQRHPWITPTIFFSYVIVCSAYYWLYSRHHQVVSSEEEVRELLVQHQSLNSSLSINYIYGLLT